MKNTGLQTPQVLRPAWFTARWNALVKQSVHAPATASSMTKTGAGALQLPSNSSNYSGPTTIQGNLIGPNRVQPASQGNLIGPNRVQPASSLSALTKVGSGALRVTSNPAIPNLWVEKGVIWQLPNLLVGFTSYSAATAFFSSVASFGYQAAPSSWYEGTPFSATDFPILHWGKKGVEINGFLLIWASLDAMSFASAFLPMIPVNQPLIPTMRSSAGPVVPASEMGSFSSNSPTGVQTFEAKYIMYAPWGPNPLSGVSTSGSGIQYDMIMYSWWYNF